MIKSQGGNFALRPLLRQYLLILHTQRRNQQGH